MSDTTAQTVSYVRETMLAESSPPVTETGTIKWMRENLFSSVLNTVLTVLSILVIYSVVSKIGPWFWNSVWDAGSLTECREVLAAKGMTGHDGACFGVIKDRWQQLIFGFYPSEHYWRPVLALIVFLVGISPVLFDSVPRKMLILTMLTPFAMYILLWGGAIWVPLMVAAGFGVGYVATKFLSPISSLVGTLGAIILPLIFWLYFAGPIAGVLTSVAPIGLEFVPSKDFGGCLLYTSDAADE